MHYGGKISGQNRERGHRIFTANELDFIIQALNHCAKLHENRVKIEAVVYLTGTLTWTDRQTLVIL